MTDIPLDKGGAPDLQELVKLGGNGYAGITAEQWKAFNRAMADFQTNHHYRHNSLTGKYENG